MGCAATTLLRVCTVILLPDRGSRAAVYGVSLLSLTWIAGSSLAGGMAVCFLWLYCALTHRCVRRADPSSRGVLPIGSARARACVCMCACVCRWLCHVHQLSSTPKMLMYKKVRIKKKERKVSRLINLHNSLSCCQPPSLFTLSLVQVPFMQTPR